LSATEAFPLHKDGQCLVRDMKALAQKVITERTNRGLVLTREEHEDLLHHLILVQIEEANGRYDPAKDRALEKGREATFSDYVTVILRFRVIDWLRHERSDWRSSRRFDTVPLDDTLMERLAAVVDEAQFAAPSVNQALLTPEARQTYARFAIPLHDRETTMEELGERYGFSRREVSRRLDRLAEELQQNGAAA
jgi:hypothetical protein